MKSWFIRITEQIDERKSTVGIYRNAKRWDRENNISAIEVRQGFGTFVYLKSEISRILIDTLYFPILYTFYLLSCMLLDRLYKNFTRYRFTHDISAIELIYLVDNVKVGCYNVIKWIIYECTVPIKRCLLEVNVEILQHLFVVGVVCRATRSLLCF